MNRDTSLRVLPIRSHGIHLDIAAVMLIMLKVAHPVIDKTFLPNRSVRFQAIRKSPFHELHNPLQRKLWSRRKQRVHMIGHDDKLVQEESSLFAIMRQREKKESG